MACVLTCASDPLMRLFMQTPGIQRQSCLIKRNKNKTPANAGSFNWKEKNGYYDDL